MKLGIMQPYFLPYMGYFQLLASVDQFIVYDNIKYTKKGWINRNRMLQNGMDVVFSLPLKKASDSLAVVDRQLAASFERSKLLNQFRSAYVRAPQFDLTYQVLEQIVRYEDNNLFRYIHHSIMRLCQHLNISTEIKISSDIAINHELQGQDKVLALCNAVGASTYINTIGGLELYSKRDFHSRGIDLRFIRSRPFQYNQFKGPFVPCLSVVDILMFNPPDIVRSCIYDNYDLI